MNGEQHFTGGGPLMLFVGVGASAVLVAVDQYAPEIAQHPATLLGFGTALLTFLTWVFKKNQTKSSTVISDAVLALESSMLNAKKEQLQQLQSLTDATRSLGHLDEGQRVITMQLGRLVGRVDKVEKDLKVLHDSRRKADAWQDQIDRWRQELMVEPVEGPDDKTPPGGTPK